jgi:hypothetical protein
VFSKETGLLKGAAITAADIPINERHFQSSKYSNAYNSIPLYLNLMSFLLEVKGSVQHRSVLDYDQVAFTYEVHITIRNG